MIGHSIAAPFLQIAGAETTEDDADDELSRCWSWGTIGITAARPITHGLGSYGTYMMHWS